MQKSTLLHQFKKRRDACHFFVSSKERLSANVTFPSYRFYYEYRWKTKDLNFAVRTYSSVSVGRATLMPFTKLKWKASMTQSWNFLIFCVWCRDGNLPQKDAEGCIRCLKDFVEPLPLHARLRSLVDHEYFLSWFGNVLYKQNFPYSFSSLRCKMARTARCVFGRARAALPTANSYELLPLMLLKEKRLACRSFRMIRTFRTMQKPSQKRAKQDVWVVLEIFSTSG